MSDAHRRRYLDPERAGLGGIGAEQEVDAETHDHGNALEAPAPYDVWKRVPGADGASTGPGDVTYYDRPVIKEPVWIWSVPLYFFTGGAAGAAAVLGAVTQNVDGLEGLTRRARWLATLGTGIGTVLLVIDLGRPERFLNMLRVFRPTSPMSLGSWLLAATSGAATVSAIGSHRDGPIATLGDVAGLGGGLFGGPLAGYTAVLITNTAVPAWQGAYRTLPAQFAASATTGAASLLQLTSLTDREAAVVTRFGTVGAAADLALGQAVEREVGRDERAARPYHEGVSGSLMKLSKVATTVSLVLNLLPGRGRLKRSLAGLAGVVGSLSLRFAVFQAGKTSARDPRATFQQQRAGHGAAEVTGTAGVTGPDGRRAVR